MNDFDFINTFFNIIYQNEPAYMRDFVYSYEYVQSFHQWLKSRSISFNSLNEMKFEDFYMFRKNMKAADIDRLFHYSLCDDLNRLSESYYDSIHILYIHGLNNEKIIDIPFQEYKGIYFYSIHDSFIKEDLSFFDPFEAFFCAMNHVDLWPGVLIFNSKNQVFTSIHTQDDFNVLLKHIDNKDDLFDVYQDYENDAYFIQLSDTHLGKNKRQKGLAQLYSSLDFIVPSLYSNYKLNILITGDLMESPNRKNMYLANDFMNSLKKIYKANVTFILGNHDVIVHGFNMARNQKSKVIAYLLGENIKVLESQKVILIKMDTTSEGNLARGKIGQRQLDEIDDELAAIENLEEYMLVVMVHHHVYPIGKAQFLKTKWHEKTFINRIVETSKVLVDAPMLIEWLKKRNVHYVFHGHKHLPFLRENDGIYYIGAGSATGGLKESQSRYISYNVVKYNVQDKKIKTCMIFYDDKAKAERQRVEVYLLREDKDEDSR
ncbi:MAG: metallophosphoesterase [Coprobacillus sp.]